MWGCASTSRLALPYTFSPLGVLRTSVLNSSKMGVIPQPHDPNTPGPFNVCLRCYRLHSRTRGYCLKCGNRWGFQTIWKEHRGVACARHPQEAAVGFCCLCGKPGCRECIDEKASGLDLYTGAQLHHCAVCLNDSAAREARFLSQLKAQKWCAKHKGSVWKFRCTNCSSPLCESCSYFKVFGVWRKRIGTEPYCLVCFRSTDHKKKKWASGLTVKKEA